MYIRKLLVVLLFTLVIGQEDNEPKVKLGFIPEFIDGKTILTREEVVYGGFKWSGTSLTATKINQESFNEDGQSLASIDFYSLIANRGEYFTRVMLTADEVLELKTGMDILFKQHDQEWRKRKSVMGDFTLKRNSSGSNLISYSNIQKFDSNEMEFTDQVTFYKYDEIVCTLSYTSEFLRGYYKSYFYLDNVRLSSKKRLSEAINKLHEIVIEYMEVKVTE